MALVASRRAGQVAWRGVGGGVAGRVSVVRSRRGGGVVACVVALRSRGVGGRTLVVSQSS
ncbi:hypothetical protein ACXZ9C_10585 [Streptococcus agalactiae]